jgi:O-methyltransferase
MKRLIKRFVSLFGFQITRIHRSNINYQEIFKKFSDYTMIPSDNYVDNLKLCEKYKFLEGDIVECGTWKGGMIAGIAEVLGDTNRTYFLFDSFEGLPLAKIIDGESAINWQNNKESEAYYDNCSADILYAKEAMRLSRVKNVQIIKGWFNQTLPGFNKNNRIAILRLDGDWYESIMECMEYLYPYVVKNGLVIIDDYYIWDGTSRAIHNYLAKINSTSKIYTLCTGIAYIIKNE